MVLLSCGLPTAPEDAFESDEHEDGEKPAAGEVVTSIAGAVSVVAIRAEVRTADAVWVPERAEDETSDQRDCCEDEDD